MKGNWGDDEVSSIADTAELGFVDYDNDKSVCSYDPSAEGPVIISIPFPFVNDKPQSVLFGDFVNDKITITNTTNGEVDLWKVDIYDSNPKGSFTISIMQPPSENSDDEYIQGFHECFCLEDRVLHPEQTFNVWLICKPKGTGVHSTAVHFEVGDNVIERLVVIMVDDKISRSLVSSKPYHRDKKKKQLVVDRSAKDTYIPTIRPVRQMNRGFRHHLNSYPIAKEVREAVNSNQLPDGITDGLMKENYCAFFSTLLNMEEITLEEEMRGYDMECVSFGRKGRYLTLEVPGLAEKRPSLVFGDYVFAKLASDDDTTPPYQGFIHRVEAEEVHLQFDKDFHSNHISYNLYNVQFTYNRVNMRKLYEAIGATGHLGTDFLFPSDLPYKRKIKPTQLGPFSDNLNEEQQRSVEMIMGCRGGPPYVIYGPPGTGKTVTIVEAILQLYRGKKDTRILVCAPSNNAADNILEILLDKLGELKNNNDILRLNAATRHIEDIKQEYLRFCYFDDESSFTCPTKRELPRFRIIISTYMSSFSLYAEGLRRGHFSHIFLDEAGQASEPETMVPLSHLCAKGTVVVLAGDPCQLGPVIHSRVAENWGLSVSFLARLFDCDCYYEGNENYVTKLVRNYRCHREILFLPSHLFYGDELIAMRTEDPSKMKWADLLPNKEFPVLFMGIQGCDEREGNNPSWFNRIEVSKVVEIVRMLIEEKGLSGEDIGVIAPYRQQVIKVSNVLESLGCSGVKVGSVEQFQGQERRVIIVSTVRSTIKHNEFDKIHVLGFLSNYRRFNVAVTRAKSLLIIIGNPHIIGKDKYWNLLLWRCVDNESYQGCPLPERESFEDFPTQEEEQWGCEGQENNATQEGEQWGYGGQENNATQEGEQWGYGGQENNATQEGEQWGYGGQENNATQEGEQWGYGGQENNATQEGEQWSYEGQENHTTQEEEQWGYEGQENNTIQLNELPYDKDIVQGSNDHGWGDLPNDKESPKVDKDISWDESQVIQYDKENPKINNDISSDESQVIQYDNRVPWE